MLGISTEVEWTLRRLVCIGSLVKHTSVGRRIKEVKSIFLWGLWQSIHVDSSEEIHKIIALCRYGLLFLRSGTATSKIEIEFSFILL